MRFDRAFAPRLPPTPPTSFCSVTAKPPECRARRHPSVEHELGDPEVADMAAWRDTAADAAWTRQSPSALRQIDRFHGVPDLPEWSDSWAEWLYFNGRSKDARFYLAFIVGPRTKSGNRSSSVSLQIERNGEMQRLLTTVESTDAELTHAPDQRSAPTRCDWMASSTAFTSMSPTMQAGARLAISRFKRPPDVSSLPQKSPAREDGGRVTWFP